MNWRVKGVVQKMLGALPGGVRANDVLQRRVGNLRRFRQHVAGKVLNDWAVLASHLRELGVPLSGRTYLEVGTGWFPTLPVCYALGGVRAVMTYDLNRHLDDRLTLRMLALLEEHLPTIADPGGRPLPDVEAEYAVLRSAATAEDLLRLARITYHAPADAGDTGLPGSSIDVVFSNSVLEHVPRPDILRIMHESHRVLRPGGLSLHSVNCGDHYAYFDDRITSINYLSYPDRSWQFWNNRLLYQNRLRPIDFVRLAEAAGLEIVLRRSLPSAPLLAALESMSIASEFHSYPPEELCCTSVDFAARRQ